jgi:hypothetical protein
MEIVSLIIAILALGLSAVTLHRQFFHRTRSVRLAVGWLPKAFTPKEHWNKGMSLVFTNCGTVPVILTKFDIRYAVDSQGSFLTPDHKLVFESDSMRIRSGEHMVVQLLLSDKFPGGTIEPTDSTYARDADGRPLRQYHYQVALWVEYLDDEGSLKYADLQIGDHSFNSDQKQVGFSSPSQPLELYKRG